MAQVKISERIHKDAAMAGLEFGERRLTASHVEPGPVLEKMISEGGMDFYNYLCWTGLSEQSNIMVLTSMSHYYYDRDDLKNIGALVCMKKLNHVTHLESFIHTLFRLLPSKSHFIGCFWKNRQEKDRSIIKLTTNLFSILHSGKAYGEGRELTKMAVGNLLANNGFILNDMTDLNGITFFWAQSKRLLGY